jgi:hypothetical protein
MTKENAYFFFKPVDPIADGAPDYFRYIVRPMSIFTVQEKLDKRQYESFDQFIGDMRDIWRNAKVYNHPSHAIHRAAELLAEEFEILAASLPREVPKDERTNGLQRLIEVRFARYRSLKKTHK